MGIGDICKQIWGYDNYFKMRQFIKYIRDEICFAGKNKIQHDVKLNVTEFHQNGKHVFFGYYDIQQLNSEENKMLVHVLKQNANTAFDLAELGYYDLQNKQYHKITETGAWCWQQGARLRWNPVNDTQIIYNDVEDGSYVTRVFDLNDQRIIRTIPMALYDVDNTMKYGISVNFARIQRLRPGYGYNSLEDSTIGQKAPEDDGIYLVDLEKNKVKLLFSLKELAGLNSNDGDNYINHISISPDGSKFMFFHIWTTSSGQKWKTRLYIANIDGSNLTLLEDDCELVSHYDWVNNDRIIVTSYGEDNKLRYFIYFLHNCTKKLIDNTGLRQDGHPTILSDGMSFVSDTYPIKYDVQTLFYYNIQSNRIINILKAYSNPNLYGEKRCDMHPRLSATEKFITLDSTVKKGCRRVLLIENWKELVQI